MDIILVGIHHTDIAGQKIVKALTFNGQRIDGLCKSLMLDAVNFPKSL